MWTVFKAFIDLLQYCFSFIFWFFGCEARGILVPQPGIKPTPTALEGIVLTTGLSRQSFTHRFLKYHTVSEQTSAGSICRLLEF